MWQISKSFDFCYGHRVWAQELNPEFSNNKNARADTFMDIMVR